MLDAETCITENKIYRCGITVENENADADSVLRRSELFGVLQEAVYSAIEHTNFSRSRMSALKLAWVITDQYVEIQRMPLIGEKVLVETWPGKINRVFFPRYYRIFAENGEKLVNGCSYWVLMDTEKRTLAFPELYGIREDGIVTGNETAMPGPVRRMDISNTVKFEIPPDYIDGNGHMNNAKYLDLADDVVADLRTGYAPASIQIRYIKELRQGEIADIGYLFSDGNCYIEGNSGNRPSFRIRMTGM